MHRATRAEYALGLLLSRRCWLELLSRRTHLAHRVRDAARFVDQVLRVHVAQWNIAAWWVLRLPRLRVFACPRLRLRIYLGLCLRLCLSLSLCLRPSLCLRLPKTAT